jgi:ParB/RepB/Spo0J family partition protein
MTLKTIPINKIVKGRNPRKRFDEEAMRELALSIKEHGLLQPIVVEPHKNNTYVLVMGERRLRAHELLRRTNIKAVIRDRTNHNGRERFIDAFIENDQRVDMNPIERAKAYQALIDEYHMSVRDISKQTGKTEAMIGNFLVLTRLDPEIQEMIEEGFWKDPRVARGLLEIENPKIRVELAKRLWQQKLTLAGSLLAIERTKVAIETTSHKHKPVAGRVPVIELAKAEQKPMRWDSMRQLGKLPEWDLVVHAATQTCEACPLRDIASEFNCSDCASVFLLRKLMEATQ